MAANLNAPDPEGTLGSLELSYRQYRAELRLFFARRVREPSVADDLVQEVYERLLKYRSAEPVRDPEGYLFQIARNVLWAAARNARTEERRYVSCGASELEQRAEGLSHLWIQEDGGHEIAEEEIEQVLNQLPRACRVALLRQRRDGWTYQQIADELGVSIDSVRDYLAKAFNHFRSHFSMRRRDR